MKTKPRTTPPDRQQNRLRAIVFQQNVIFFTLCGLIFLALVIAAANLASR